MAVSWGDPAWKAYWKECRKGAIWPSHSKEFLDRMDRLVDAYERMVDRNMSATAIPNIVEEKPEPDKKPFTFEDRQPNKTIDFTEENLMRVVAVNRAMG